MKRIVKIIIVWLIRHLLPGYHLHHDPRKVNDIAEHYSPVEPSNIDVVKTVQRDLGGLPEGE